MNMHKHPNIEAVLEDTKKSKKQYFKGTFEAQLSHTTKPPQTVVFKEGHMLSSALLGYFDPPHDQRHHDQRVVALWNLNSKGMAAGTYELGPDEEYQGALQVGANNPFNAHEGTLTIDAASATYRKGSFNFKAGEYEVVGTFDITVE